MQLWTICTCQYQGMHKSRVKNNSILFEFIENEDIQVKTRRKFSKYSTCRLEFPHSGIEFLCIQEFQMIFFALYPIFVYTLVCTFTAGQFWSFENKILESQIFLHGMWSMPFAKSIKVRDIFNTQPQIFSDRVSKSMCVPTNIFFKKYQRHHIKI